MIIMQGDSYYIPFLFFDEDETQITADMLTDVEIRFGSVKKTMSAGEVIYNDGQFLFPLTKEDSSAMSPTVKVVAQLTLNTGDVVGSSFGHIVVLEDDK